MSCANCSATIQDTLESLDGVHEVSINFATDEGTVEHDPDVVSLREIYDAIERAGYSPVRETATIAITDMTCANCAEANADALESTPGVVEADVNYATDEAQATYNPASVSLDALYDAIESAGYSPVRETEDSEGEGTDTAEAARDGLDAVDRPHRLRPRVRDEDVRDSRHAAAGAAAGITVRLVSSRDDSCLDDRRSYVVVR